MGHLNNVEPKSSSFFRSLGVTLAARGYANTPRIT